MNVALRRTLTVLLLLIGAVSAYLATRGIFAAGVSWDAGIDTDAAGEIRRLAPGITLQQAYDAVYFTSEYYGLLVQGVADWAHHLVTGSPEFMPSYELETYRWQAGVNVVIATLGAAGLGIGVWRTLRSGLAGAFAWALVWTIPLFEGMSHIDFKDVPVAAGLTLLSAGLMLVLRADGRIGDTLAAFGFSALGIVIALGQRVGTWPLIVVLCGSALLAVLIRSLKTRNARLLILPFSVMVSAIAIGLLGLVVLNPIARIDLPQWLFDAYSVTRKYPWDGYIRTAGGDVWSLELPWWYVPAWLGAQLPLLTSALVVAGAASMAWVAFRPSSWLTRSDLVAYVPVLVQGLLIPAIIVAMHATLYGGIRHLLFLVPPLAGIAAFAIPGLEAKAQTGRRWVVVLAATAVFPPMLGLIAIVQWFPYGYAAINPVAAMNFPTRDWDLDGWGVTAIEGVERLQKMGQTKIAADPTDFTSKMIGAATPAAINDEHLREFGYYQFIVGDHKPLPPGCERAFTIERAGLLLGEGAICRR